MGRVGMERAARAARLMAAAGACIVVANCAGSDQFASRVDPKYGVSSSPRVVDFGDPVPKGGGTYRVGKPYTVAGREYVPFEDTNYRAEGLASWYGDDFHGRLTANGEVFDMMSLTAAHPTLPMPCYVRVTNLGNGRSLIVRVNDRGPYHGNRLIDVSHNAARLLDFRSSGIARVRVEYVGRAPLEGSDDRLLEATLRTGEPAPAPSTIRVASVRPFVPEGAAGGRPIRGEVPIPGSRPYTLGNANQDVAATAPAASNVRAVSYDETGGDRSSAMTRPVTAYAPVAPGQDGISSLLSGRGLY